MFKFTVLVAAVLATTSAVSAATVSTPTALTQCQPVLITWSDAQGKVYVSVLPGKETSAAPLVRFAPQDAGTTSIKWVPNLPAGQDITLSISDDSGVTNYSGTVTVRAGTDTSCLNTSGSAAADGSAATTGSSSSSGSGSSSNSSGSSGSSGSASSPSSSGKSSTSNTSSANSANQTSSGNSSSGATSFRADTTAMVSSALAVAAVAVAVFA
ncbi:uncharacterized protein UMAG_03977 [Mycosarcoma maydis]|uniref:Uncharacterized protein n=1 Tax=Mycosarcoma maydis TaxID=5270 RepID=A0A0D1DW83_MYCMD|nr:uncharacterized protein UMAG_03977 [Ustilago maydis 521]KIS67926.1 hypothetical protein UMAG_03977 [Ustilago maydis 521]|eukprot:XP_011390439.1 hypothetical protein UMAG_03977 [Ustilago maydis 521]